MSNLRKIPVHTPIIVMGLAEGPASFGQMLKRYSISPSTLSKILKFLRSGRCIKHSTGDPGKWDGPRKVYNLTPKGRRLLPAVQRILETEKAISDIIG